MEIEIDQSYKIELTNRSTAIAFTNDVVRSILIPASVKQQLVVRLRGGGKRGKRITLHVFAAAVFLLIHDYLSRIEQIVIDQEYQGNEADLRQILLNFIWETQPHFRAGSIIFRRVGKGSRAHVRALQVHRGHARADRVVRVEDISRLIRHKKKSSGKPF